MALHHTRPISSSTSRSALPHQAIEFKRAHLYDINPVGVGSMALSATIALMAHFGTFGARRLARALLTLIVAFTASPLIAWGTKGKFYLARKPRQQWRAESSITCSICEHPFEPEDMAWCPAYAAPNCSLCCSLDSRCHDMCKPKAKLNYQVATVAKTFLPRQLVAKLATRLGRNGMAAAMPSPPSAHIGHDRASGRHGLTGNGRCGQSHHPHRVFVFAVIAGIVCWFLVLAHDSRVVAEEEFLAPEHAALKEIAAHKKTDAALQDAKETAEAANRAKSRLCRVGLSHELRTPLNAVLGYAQILERDETIPPPRQSAIKVIRRSADHLSGLIDGLLDISKIEAGRLQVYSNEINIQDFLDQNVDMFRPQAQAKGLNSATTARLLCRNMCAPMKSACARSSSTCFPTHQIHGRRRRHLRCRYRSQVAASPCPIPAAALRKRTSPASTNPSSVAKPKACGPCRASARAHHHGF